MIVSRNLSLDASKPQQHNHPFFRGARVMRLTSGLILFSLQASVTRRNEKAPKGALLFIPSYSLILTTILFNFNL